MTPTRKCPQRVTGAHNRKSPLDWYISQQVGYRSKKNISHQLKMSCIPNKTGIISYYCIIIESFIVYAHVRKPMVGETGNNLMELSHHLTGVACLDFNLS